MTGKNKKGGLGKGLEALFVDNTAGDGGVVTLRVSEIEPNKGQPRKDFDEGALADLADSIRVHGVIQPLLVRPVPTGGYQLVAGERRWRASRMAGLAEVPVVIREMSDNEVMELALIENLQREDLNPLEEALGYQALIEAHGMTQEQVAQTIGKSRPAVANALRLLRLPQEVSELVRQGALSAGHARALLGMESPEQIIAAAKLAVEKELSVREVEKIARISAPAPVKEKKEPKKENYYRELELALETAMGRKVKIHSKGKKGALEIEYFDKEDLAALAEKLSGEKVSSEDFAG
ncbi:MAG: ParB/RepB/Spo0J family partition protein [Oscillospiraceae bacterium]|nr:ParB/RepB/Spo0J family partition protein [Oscillospiraceae bacterium]